MPTLITAGDASNGVVVTSSNDNALTIQTGPNGGKVNAIALASDGTPTFAKVPVNTTAQSMVRLNTANGYGSTNTRIRRFTNTVTNQGADITYADSATLGATFTINTAGVYAASYSDQYSAADKVEITLNDSAPTGAPVVGDILAGSQTAGASANSCAAWTGYLVAGSVIRARSESGTSSGTDTKACQFTITRVA